MNFEMNGKLLIDHNNLKESSLDTLDDTGHYVISIKPLSHRIESERFIAVARA